MDNKKIGKLIASLRKELNLTQQELGDKVGVGFRAVSKWERGQTLPDITIINELSKILGITSDELLSGEIDKTKRVKNQKKLPKKIRVMILTITIAILMLFAFLIYHNNKTYVYNLISKDNATIAITGQVTFQNNKISLVVHKLRFVEDHDLKNKIIKNYEYQISSNGTFIYGFGYSPNGDILEKGRTIQEFTEQFEIKYSGDSDLTRKEIIDNDLNITLKLIDEDGKEITKEIEAVLYKPNDKEK